MITGDFFVLLFLSKPKCMLQYLFVCVLMLRERKNMKQLSVYLLAKWLGQESDSGRCVFRNGDNQCEMYSHLV